MALRINSGFLAQAASRTQQPPMQPVARPPANTGDNSGDIAAAAQTSQRLRAEADGMSSPTGFAREQSNLQAETRQITEQRTPGTAQDRAGQQANEVAAPAWQATVGLQQNMRGPLPSQENTRSSDYANALGGITAPGAARSTMSLNVVNQTGGAQSSSNSTQGRTMAGERDINAYKTLQQTGAAELAQANQQLPQQALSLMA
ncbi:hypothetical protein [Diaphorobacter sp.]|uniref:hypothetical protein n=1 Tax=Diaphorobacter sp. TaxID=1934310 RepID=UPI003D10366C